MFRTTTLLILLIVSFVTAPSLIAFGINMDGLEVTADRQESESAEPEQYLDQIEALLDEVEKAFGGPTKTVEGYSDSSEEWTRTFRGWSEQLEELWRSFQESTDEKLSDGNNPRTASFAQAVNEVERRYKSHFSVAGPEALVIFNELVEEAERERNNLRIDRRGLDRHINLVSRRQFRRLPQTTSWEDSARRRLVTLLPEELIDEVNDSLEKAYDKGYDRGYDGFGSFGSGSAYSYHFRPFAPNETNGQHSEQLDSLAQRARQALAQMDDFRATYEQDLSYKKEKMYVSRSLSEQKRDEIVARYGAICEDFAKAMAAYEETLRPYLENYPGDADNEAKRGLAAAWEAYEKSPDFQFIIRYKALKERAESYQLVRSGIQRNLRLAKAPRWRNERKAEGSAKEAIDLLPAEMSRIIESTRDRAESSGYYDGVNANEDDDEDSLF